MTITTRGLRQGQFPIDCTRTSLESMGGIDFPTLELAPWTLMDTLNTSSRLPPTNPPPPDIDPPRIQSPKSFQDTSTPATSVYVLCGKELATLRSHSTGSPDSVPIQAYMLCMPDMNVFLLFFYVVKFVNQKNELAAKLVSKNMSDEFCILCRSRPPTRPT